MGLPLMAILEERIIRIMSAGAIVADGAGDGAAGLVIFFLEDGIEDELAFLDAAAGNPLHLHEELGAEPQQSFLGAGNVGLPDQGRVHGAAPARILRIVGVELGGHQRHKLMARRFVDLL